MKRELENATMKAQRLQATVDEKDGALCELRREVEVKAKERAAAATGEARRLKQKMFDMGEEKEALLQRIQEVTKERDDAREQTKQQDQTIEELEEINRKVMAMMEESSS